MKKKTDLTLNKKKQKKQKKQKNTLKISHKWTSASSVKAFSVVIRILISFQSSLFVKKKCVAILLTVSSLKLTKFLTPNSVLL